MKDWRISILHVTPEGRLLEEAVCSIKDGEARWHRLIPDTAEVLNLAYQALAIIPKESPPKETEPENN